MRTRLFIVGWLLWLPLLSTAFAADRSLSVTIYADDLALVDAAIERMQLTLDEGSAG